MKLNVLQMPDIIEAPRTSLTNESDRLELHCRASGSPAPEIYWMINGENTRFDSLVTSQGSRLVIRSVEKRHAGIVQCFARNEVGEVNEGALLQVNPKQIDGEGKPIPLGMPQKSRSRNNNRTPNERRKNKGRKLNGILLLLKIVIRSQEFSAFALRDRRDWPGIYLVAVDLWRLHSRSHDKSACSSLRS